MRNWLKKMAKYKISLIAIFLVSIIGSCSKSNNPFDIPNADSSQYGGDVNDGIIRILAIGNSFSEDAIENSLYELAKEKGITVIIGNLYIGGASLADHKINVENKRTVYNYRKIGKDGKKTAYDKVRIDVAIEDEHWDYISFQQVSQNSGQLETVQESLPAVFNYVKAKATNSNVKYIYHQTWAYAQTSTHSGFPNYDSDQMKMYNAIVDVSVKVKKIVPIDIIVPAGTAIQNGRTSAIEDGFTRDGYHLNIPLGRYTAACTWFETLFNQSVVGMQYKPEGILNFEATVAQNAAHMAVLKPFEITQMIEFQGEGGPLDNPVLLDFGNGAASDSWNQIKSFLVGTKVNLKDSEGKEYIGLSLTILERFNGENTAGPQSTTTLFNMPPAVSSRSFFGNSKAVFSGMIITQSVFTISGLDKNLTYNMCFFGSRPATNNRETKYTVSGTNEGVARLNAAGNTTDTDCVNNISPDANGKITITVTSGENNNDSSGFYYLNAAKLTSN